MSDYAEVRAQVPFALLDVDNDGKLNILTLLQVHHHLYNKSCLVAIELSKLFQEYKLRNVHLKDGFRN
jgi:hypothetical protein